MPGVKFRKGRRKPSAKPAADGELLPLAAPAEESLLPSDADWSDLWRGMPAYEMGSTEAFRRVTVHFRDEDEVEAFGKLIGVDMTDRTSTIWFTPPENYVAPKMLIYSSVDRRPPRYPIYIPSVGRWVDSW